MFYSSWMCSTPFGVIGLFTRHPSPESIALKGAQRRLASLDCSHYSRGPFSMLGDVLNAVWRHWIVHTFNAGGAKFSKKSAQRRLASLDCSLTIRRLYRSVVCLVLNAVWRHWIVHDPDRAVEVGHELCSTPFGVIGLFTRDGMGRVQASSGCSTPFGVIGLFTLSYAEILANVSRCSTPFGVIGLFTSETSPERMTVHGCSTPFGVIGLFTFAMPFTNSGYLKCSTPFGVIGLFTNRQREGPAVFQSVLNAVWRHWIVHGFLTAMNELL